MKEAKRRGQHGTEMGQDSGLRLAVAIDGGYHWELSKLFKYHSSRPRTPDLETFRRLLLRHAAQEAGVSYHESRITWARHYSGYHNFHLQNAGTLRFKQVLQSCGYETRWLPLVRQNGGFIQKGVDVMLSMDSLEGAMNDEYDVLALVTGDRDFLPLVRRLQELDKSILLAAWLGEDSEDTLGTAQSLIETADWVLDLCATYSGEQTVVGMRPEELWVS